MKNFDSCIDLQDFLTQVGEFAKAKDAYGVAVVIYCKHDVGTIQWNATKDDLALGASALHMFSLTKDVAKLH